MITIENASKVYSNEYVAMLKEKVSINETQETFIKYLLEGGFVSGAKTALKSISSTCDKLMDTQNE